MANLQRHGENQSVNISSVLASCSLIDLTNFAGGMLHIPAALTVTVCKFQVSHDGTTFVNVYDSSATELARTVAAGRAMALPDEVFGARYLKITSNQAAVEACFLTLKS